MEDVNNDARVNDIFEIFRMTHENIDHHEVLNDIVTFVSIGVLKRHNWLVNMTFEIKGQSHRFRHDTCKLLKICFPLNSLY